MHDAHQSTQDSDVSIGKLKSFICYVIFIKMVLKPPLKQKESVYMTLNRIQSKINEFLASEYFRTDGQMFGRTLS